MSATPRVPSPRPSAPVPGDGLARYLAALQLGDSAFPSGRYTLSHGLEALTQSGRLAGPDRPARLRALLEDCIRLGVAPSDGVALACAHRAIGVDALDLAAIIAADERLTATKLAREARTTSIRTGRALLRTATAAFPLPPLFDYAEQVTRGGAPGNHAVVLGVLTASLNVPRTEAVAGDLHAFAAGWLSAAMRLALVDHRSAQAVLYRVHPVIVEAALAAADRPVTQIASCTPLLDVMSMRHEQAELRLFAS